MRETVGRYKLLDRLGAGGVGETYRARDLQQGRTVALKIVAPEIAVHPELRTRFLNDAHAAAALSHHNIAAVYEVGEEQDLIFLAMEFVPGETIAALTTRGPLNARRAIDYGIQLADALAEGHACQVSHGDVSAGNVIVTPKGHAKLREFGLSQWSTRVRTGGIRDDIWGLGEVLLQLVGGTLSSAANHETGSAAARFDQQIPRELETLISKMLANVEESRRPSAAVVAAELREIADGLDGRPQPTARVSAASSRSPVVSPIGLLLVAMAGLALLGAIWMALER